MDECVDERMMIYRLIGKYSDEERKKQTNKEQINETTKQFAI